MMEEENVTTDYSEFTKNYSEELKNGIFHLSVSMCQHLSNFVPMEQAKEMTAQWLEEIAKGLRTVQKNPLERN
jgi:hypothetical protein